MLATVRGQVGRHCLSVLARRSYLHSHVSTIGAILFGPSLLGYTECWPAHAAALAQHTAGGLSRASISCLRLRVRANAMPYCHCRS